LLLHRANLVNSFFDTKKNHMFCSFPILDVIFYQQATLC